MGIYASILNNNYTFANSHVRKQQSVALLELPPEVLLAGLDSEGPPTVAAAEPPRLKLKFRDYSSETKVLKPKL